MSGPVCPLGWVLLHQVCLYTAHSPGGHSWHQALSLCTEIQESKDWPAGQHFLKLRSVEQEQPRLRPLPGGVSEAARPRAGGRQSNGGG